MPYSLAHGNGILTTATDLLFIGQPDGNLICLDAHNGGELWGSRPAPRSAAARSCYELDGEQYLAVYAGGTGIPYGNSAPRGDYLWAFKIGGTVAPAPTPTPPDVRRPVYGAARSRAAWSTTPSCWPAASTRPPCSPAEESAAPDAHGTHASACPGGHDGDVPQPGGQHQHHGATQFFEGLFNVLLAPGESFQYRFDKRGEYFFNDPTSARPTGKIEVY